VREPSRPRSSPSASLVKISAISRTDVPFNPLPRVRRPAARRTPFLVSFSLPLHLLVLFPFFLLTFSLTLLPAMLCFAEDRICQIPREKGRGRRGVSLKWRASGCQRAPRAPVRAAVFGCDDTYRPALSACPQQRQRQRQCNVTPAAMRAL
jgi:hypothetical protein